MSVVESVCSYSFNIVSMDITEVMDYASLFVNIENELNFLQQVYVAGVLSRTSVNTDGLQIVSRMVFLNNFVTDRIGIFMDWPPDHSV